MEWKQKNPLLIDQCDTCKEEWRGEAGAADDESVHCIFVEYMKEWDSTHPYHYQFGEKKCGRSWSFHKLVQHLALLYFGVHAAGAKMLRWENQRTVKWKAARLNSTIIP